jgi:catechol 2,3-dioxygenase-like lactoylglutathione lyase family enzyme
MSQVSRILRLSITVSDMARLMAFYRDALGFSFIEASDTKIDGVPGRRVWMRLGGQTLELFAPDRLGDLYPAGSRATDAWFQHLAIVVADMDAAYAHLQGYDMTPITLGGPQHLPRSTGGVRAFKFRDPDGHPLELIAFPPGVGDSRWQAASADALFLGFDHSAIVVDNYKRSVAFYEGFGFCVVSRGVNQGSAQEHLDDAPDVLVDVVALQPAAETTPHLELLGYRNPGVRSLRQPLHPSDVAAARLVLSVSDGAGEPRPDLRGLPQHDPDGHGLLFEPEA